MTNPLLPALSDVHVASLTTELCLNTHISYCKKGTEETRNLFFLPQPHSNPNWLPLDVDEGHPVPLQMESIFYTFNVWNNISAESIVCYIWYSE